MDLNNAEISLAEAVKFVVDNRGRSAPTVEHGIPLIATNCISNQFLFPTYDRLRYVSDETYRNWFRSHPEPGDIILTNKGSQNGAVCLVPDPVGFCIAQDMVALRANEAIIDPLYLFAALRSKIVQNRIKNLNVDAVIPHFKKTDFDKLLIPYPNREEQEYIGRFYYQSSRRIELNRRMNETLEAMAQALFKSWFVDFDPVIDNAMASGKEIPEELRERADARAALGDRRKPLPEEIRTLFPDEFTYSEEMGWIPLGWEVQSLDAIAHYQNGLALQKYRPSENEEYLPIVKIAQLRAGVSTLEERASAAIDPACIIDNVDVVFSWSGILMVDLWCGGKAALNQHLFKVTAKAYPSWFYYYWTKHHLANFQRIAAYKAVTMGHIKRSHLEEALCAVPKGDLFSVDHIAQLVRKQIDLRLQNNILSNLRDNLLPKLLSGELRIPDAEKMMEDLN